VGTREPPLEIDGGGAQKPRGRIDRWKRLATGKASTTAPPQSSCPLRSTTPYARASRSNSDIGDSSKIRETGMEKAILQKKKKLEK
jgi:hypothetical protein